MRGITLPKKDKYTINIFVLDANEFKHYRINHSKLFIKKYNHWELLELSKKKIHELYLQP